MKPKKPKPKLRKHRFLVGYPIEGDRTYGRDHFRVWDSAMPMTALQAKRALKKMLANKDPYSNRSDAVIFELVKVEGTDK